MLLEVQHLDKSFGSEQVIRDLSFQLPARETLSILGRSGCGKTTLLKLIAGLMEADQGKVLVSGEDISQTPPQQRGIVYLYQEALLFPHLNVTENIAFGLRLRREPEEQIQHKTMEMLNQLGLRDHARKKPGELSGGQRQRVAFGRALIINPRLLLLDEPFGNLDVETRKQMQLLFREIATRRQISALFVTHDLKEAILMGHTLAYMEQGQLTVYPHATAFMRDPRTGMQEELAFWNHLNEVQSSDHEEGL